MKYYLILAFAILFSMELMGNDNSSPNASCECVSCECTAGSRCTGCKCASCKCVSKPSESSAEAVPEETSKEVAVASVPESGSES